MTHRPRPLSSGQQRVWFFHRLIPLGVYNEAVLVRLCGPLHIHALRRALRGLIERHEILRSIFFEQNGVPAQAVRDDTDIPFTTFDMRGQSWRDANVQRTLDTEESRLFDLNAGCVRAAVIKLS